MISAAYVRVSLEEGERQTVATQRGEILRVCDVEKRELAPELIFSDDISGTITLVKRPGGAAMLEAAREGKFHQLLIYKVDRMGRNARVILNAVHELEKLGVRVRSITEPFDTGSPAGRFMLTMLAANAAFERDNIVTRTSDGSRRMARQGVWLGGIVPYGYRKVGEKKDARLEVSAAPIPGPQLSESQVIQRIYQKAAEGVPCQNIADDLKRLGVPPAYSRDGRAVLRGKRKENTAGIWRASRIRNMIVNRTYMGVHVYGKRKTRLDESDQRHLAANPPDQWITRDCPAVVSKEIWEQANAALHRNQITAMAHPKYQYLLRGLIRCGLCGRTYSAVAGARRSGKREFYYRCGARYRQDRSTEKCCSAPNIRGGDLEAAVWAEIRGFLAQPGAVLRELERQVGSEESVAQRAQEEIRRFEAALSRKVEARERIIELYSEGVLNRTELNQQQRRISESKDSIERELATLRKATSDREASSRALKGAGDLLVGLRMKLDDGKLPFAIRRQIVEALVASITVRNPPGQARPNIEVQFTFDPHFDRYLQRNSVALDNTPVLVDFMAIPRANVIARARSFNAISPG